MVLADCLDKNNRPFYTNAEITVVKMSYSSRGRFELRVINCVITFTVVSEVGFIVI